MSSPDPTPPTAGSTVGRHSPPLPAPAALRWLVVGIGASILLLVGLPVLMVIKRTELVTAIERETPGTLSEEWMSWIVVFVLAYAIVLHLVDVILLLWLTPKILRGRQWARIALTVYLVVATAASLYSATMGGMYLAVVIPTDVLHVLMATLLWAPPSVRRFFAEHRADRRGAAAQKGAQPDPSR